MIRTVTFRLALWYAGLFASLSLVVFVLVYFALESSLRRRMDENLHAELEEFGALYRARGIEELRSSFRYEAESLGITRVFLLLLSPDLNKLAATDMGAWKGIDLAPSLFRGLRAGREGATTIPIPGCKYEARVMYRKVHDGTILLIGSTLEEDEGLMQSVSAIFGAAFVVMLACGGFMGWFVGRRAMIGVNRVTQTALRIGKGDFSQRVQAGGEGEEIQRLALAFNDMIERIHLLVAELKEVTNNIAHDLRSPITRIRGIAEAALMGKQSVEGYREAAGMVVEESDRLAQMINTALEIAEADSGIAKLSRSPVDVTGVVMGAGELFQPVAEDKGVLLDVDLPRGPLIVAGDVARLQRVVANLLDNAVKYTPSGGRVLLSAEENGTHVVISVKDSGIGIDEEEMPRIFEQFYRGDSSRSAPGNGLGLSLARAIVRAHGGRIGVESRTGTGSIFTVFLPRPHITEW